MLLLSVPCGWVWVGGEVGSRSEGRVWSTRVGGSLEAVAPCLRGLAGGCKCGCPVRRWRRSVGDQ